MNNNPNSVVPPVPTDIHVAPGPVQYPVITGEPRLRVWPAAIIIALQWIIVTAAVWAAPATMVHFMAMMLGPIIGTAAVIVWWLFFGGARWSDRLICVVAFAAIGALAFAFFDSTLGSFGLIMYALPAATTAWVGWLFLTPFLSWPVRRAGLIVVFVLAWGYHDLIRFDGANGMLTGQTSFRWLANDEAKFLAERNSGKIRVVRANADAPTKPLALQAGDWSGFRGPNRDGQLNGVRIATDWSKNPPKPLWRHRVGPGWGSFSVVGNHLFTQEQWGDDEAVVCYDASTGEIVWDYKYPARFTEPVAGPGPRATPTFHEGKLYVMGAAGTFNCLDAATGKVHWTRDIVKDSGAKVPDWGFASSPLVVQGIVTVFAGAPDGNSVLGYSADTGELKWSKGEGALSYCSLHLTKLGGVDQLVIATDKGLAAFEPTKGTVLWSHNWELNNMARVVQPTILSDGDVLLGTGFGFGTKRIHIDHKGEKWATGEVWTSRAIKPYYNDLVVHKGHLYGFDGNFFTCVNLEDGKSKWRERGYGNGQVLLLADQDLLLVLAETGEVALVEANPEEHKELGQFPALEGKTWNHPVIAHGKLFVRNGAEAACYQLNEIAPAAKQSDSTPKGTQP